MCIEVPRDREGSFEPLLIANHERRFTGLAKATVRCHRDKLWTLGGELIRSRYDDEELADKDVKGACDSSSKAMVDR